MPAREQATSSHRENLDRWHYISRASDAQFANHLGASDRAEPATVEKESESNCQDRPFWATGERSPFVTARSKSVVRHANQHEPADADARYREFSLVDR